MLTNSERMKKAERSSRSELSKTVSGFVQLDSESRSLLTLLRLTSRVVELRDLDTFSASYLPKTASNNILLIKCFVRVCAVGLDFEVHFLRVLRTSREKTIHPSDTYVLENYMLLLLDLMEIQSAYFFLSSFQEKEMLYFRLQCFLVCHNQACWTIHVQTLTKH